MADKAQDFSTMSDAELDAIEERAAAARKVREDRKKAERKGVIDSLKLSIKEHKVTAKELGFRSVEDNSTSEGNATAPKKAAGTGTPKTALYGVKGVMFSDTYSQTAKRGQQATFTGSGPMPNPLKEWMKSPEGLAWSENPKNTTWLPLIEGAKPSKEEDNKVTPAQRKAKWYEWSVQKVGAGKGPRKPKQK